MPSRYSPIGLSCGQRPEIVNRLADHRPFFQCFEGRRDNQTAGFKIFDQFLDRLHHAARHPCRRPQNKQKPGDDHHDRRNCAAPAEQRHQSLERRIESHGHHHRPNEHRREGFDDDVGPIKQRTDQQQPDRQLDITGGETSLAAGGVDVIAHGIFASKLSGPIIFDKTACFHL